MANWFSKLNSAKQRSLSSGQALSLHQFEKQALGKLKQVAPEGYIAVKFDIDRFAELKGRYGSARGEELLRELTAVLANAQGGKYLFTQQQSEKFLVLSENEPNFMQNLQQTLAQAVQGVGLEKYVGVIRFSFGAYEVFSTEESVQTIIDKVSIAHKTAGKNPHKTVVWYDAALVQAIEQENYYNEHLLDSIVKGEFKVYLQRQVALATPNALRAKALVRWAMPDGRLVYPDSFIPQFEKNGMMVHLDFYIFEQVCQYLQALQMQGDRNVVITLSVSSVTLFQPDFLARFTKLIHQYQVQPSQIALEVQQAALVEGEVAVQDTLVQLKEQGFALAIDVVASGHSNMRILAELPVQILKIDRQFMRATESNPKIAVIIGGICQLAHNLSMQVLCEGVEHQHDVVLLQQLGCDIAQGYFLMKAAPMGDFLLAADEADRTLQAKLTQG